MALCTLIKMHRENEAWPQTVFTYTVDHKVRPESHEEATMVGEWVRKMGFQHRVLPLQGRWPITSKQRNLETVLRGARLKVLLERGDLDGVDTILAGHHQDDQYETALIRLARGSTIIGLGGIAVSNGRFLRPQLDYSKGQLRATCMEYKTPWVEDPTNNDKSFALRNAVRHLVQSQKDLPLTLQKASIISLTKIGNHEREELSMQVNNLVRTCSILREAFTGQLKVKVPKRILLDSSPRILKRFLPALARIYYSGKVEEFEFRGTRLDRVSTTTVRNLVNPQIVDINALSLSFRKIDTGKESGDIAILISPDEPRRSTFTIQTLQFSQTVDGWKAAIIDPKDEWWRPWKITVSVKEDRNYYFRRLNKYELSSIEQIIPNEEQHIWKNGLGRAKYYPRGHFPVLCHRENGKEIVDALPRFRLDLSREDVRSSCSGNYDLSEQEQMWRKLELDDDMHR